MKRYTVFGAVLFVLLVPGEFICQNNSGITKKSNFKQSVKNLPSVYDLRSVNGENYVTPIKMQRGGTCWAHATIAAIESNLLITNVWENEGEIGYPDLSEYHLDWWNGFNQFFNEDLDPVTGDGLEVHNGGDYRVAAAYISRCDGTVIEEGGLDYYFYENPPRFSDSYKYFYPRDIEWYSINDDLSNIDIVKKAIMGNGAVGTCMCYNKKLIDKDYIHYQPDNNNFAPNHAIAIIGWDDNKTTQASAKGAWLCKNSWSEDYGYNGCFWISYYDYHCGKNPEMGAVSFQNTERMKYDHVFYHDYHGWRATLENTTEAFNVFRADDSRYLEAVSFYTATNNVCYKIIIYDELINGETLSVPLSTEDGIIAYSGFHTIDLSTSVPVTRYDDFYIYLYLSAGGHPYDMTSEISVLLGATSTGTTVNSTSKRGESFYRKDGQWVDLYDSPFPTSTGNFCIKGLCSGTFVNVDEPSVPKQFGLSQNYPNPFNPSTTINFAITNSGYVTLKVYDLLGREIAVLVDGELSAGKHTAQFNGAGLASSIYIYKLEAASQDGKYQHDIKKMILIK